MNEALKGKRLAEFSYLVERWKIREMAEAIGDPNPLHTVHSFGEAAGFGGITTFNPVNRSRVQGSEVQGSGLVKVNKRKATLNL